MNSKNFSSRLSLGGVVVGLVLSSTGSASAWEAVYGATNSTDSGARGVAPVRFCAGGGFISVGTQQVTGVPSNAYVVRTNTAGAPIFERIYNIGAAGASDRGNAIVELRDGAGFVVAGSSNITGLDDAFLLRIDCNGNVVWSFTYGGPQADAAMDVIEATSGNPAVGTAAGDLVATGFTTNPGGGSPDGLLFRVKSNGAMIWNRRYDAQGATERFASLTEARPSLASPTGDIVAVGNSRSGLAPDQGYVVRVSGDNGAVGVGGNTCAALYGGGDTERFTAVVESRFGAPAGQLILAGTSFSAAQANDLYLVRALPNPCFSIAQRRIGAPATSPLGDEFPADVKQLAVSLAIAPTGSIVLTGGVGQSGTDSFDAFLLSANFSTLAPFTGRRYGDHAARREQGASLFELSTMVPAGVVIAGLSDRDSEGVGDPRDMYLIRTDVAGNTSCSLNWVPPSVPVSFPPVQVLPTATPVLAQVARPVAVAAQLTPFERCP